MALTNLEAAVNQLGVAKEEFGFNSVKKAQLLAAIASLDASLAGDTLTGTQTTSVNEARNQASFAIETGEGGIDSPMVHDRRLNEPYHTKRAFDLSLAALNE